MLLISICNLSKTHLVWFALRNEPARVSRCGGLRSWVPVSVSSYAIHATLQLDWILIYWLFPISWFGLCITIIFCYCYCFLTLSNYEIVQLIDQKSFMEYLLLQMFNRGGFVCFHRSFLRNINNCDCNGTRTHNHLVRKWFG